MIFFDLQLFPITFLTSKTQRLKDSKILILLFFKILRIYFTLPSQAGA